MLNMNRIALFFLVCCIACNKRNSAPPNEHPVNVTVRATVDNLRKNANDNQEYWRVGILFNTTSIKAKGHATVTWYFSAGWIAGNPSNHFSASFPFVMDGTTNGFFMFTNWKVDYTMRADSIKIADFKLDSGNYKVTIIK